MGGGDGGMYNSVHFFKVIEIVPLNFIVGVYLLKSGLKNWKVRGSYKIQREKLVG